MYIQEDTWLLGLGLTCRAGLWCGSLTSSPLIFAKRLAIQYNLQLVLVGLKKEKKGEHNHVIIPKPNHH